MNKKRKEIEDKIVELVKKPPMEAADFVFSVAAEYMNVISEDISAAIGTYNNVSTPWIVATLENYAGIMRRQMNKSGNELADELKDCGKMDVVQMRVPRGKVKSDADIPD